MVKAWEEHGPEFFCKIQKNIILKAAEMLRPGGMMLYSTCTFDKRENEEVILHLLQNHPEFSVCDMKPYEGFAEGFIHTDMGENENLRKTVRIFPHRMQGEGHYLALLQKGEQDQTGTKQKSARKIKKLPEELDAFLKDLAWKPDPERLEIHGERVYYMPEALPDIRGIRFLRTGLLMGEVKKNRFEPSQALAMYLRKSEYKNILSLSVEDERVIRYLKGETLETSDLLPSKAKGWYLVCVDGYPLGWGKAAGGMLKNKYLPGWRWQS